MTKIKIVGHFLALLFCIFLVASTFEIRNFFAQEQQPQTYQRSTTYKISWSNNLPNFNTAGLAQPLCQAGVCNNNTTKYNNVDSHAAVISSQTFTNSKNLDLNHAFVSNKVIGPDRFRFVTSYWTTSTTSRVIDAGSSANESRFGQALISDSWPDLNANPKLEVDTGEGFSTLAVVLQYEGVVDLAGITAALKLPAGFDAQFPLTSDRSEYSIALSSYRGHIYPSQGIVLYFDVNVLPTAKVQVPVLGPLALHFLRTDRRSILDALDGLQQNIFARALSITNITFPNLNKFNDNFDFSRDYFNQFGRFIPFDFINQVIPVIFKVTGQEDLNVHLAYAFGATGNSSKGIVPGDGTVVPVKITFTNFGDAPITNLVAVFSTDLVTFVAAATTAITFPTGIVSPTLFNLGILAPYSSQTVTLLVRSVLNCDTLEPVNVLSTFNDVIGLRQTQNNSVVLQITGNCQQQTLGVEPGSGSGATLLIPPHGTLVPGTALARR
jgi:hypothetical protein